MTQQEKYGYMKAIVKVCAFMNRFEGTEPCHTKQYLLLEDIIEGLNEEET